MIYKSYNFVESYSNADGSKKNSIVLNELGNVVRNQPTAVILALKDAGVRVPRKASRRDLVRLITANKRNRQLSNNLAILIVANTTNSNDVLLKGKDKFDNLIDPSTSPTYGPQTEAQAQAQAQSQGVGPTAQTNTERAGNLFASIGNFFKGRQDKKGKTKTTTDGTQPTGFQRFQNWFNRNRGTIGQVAQTTYDSLQTSGKIPQGGNFGNQTLPPPIPQATWIERNRGFVILGVIAIVGGVIYFAKKKAK